MMGIVARTFLTAHTSDPTSMRGRDRRKFDDRFLFLLIVVVKEEECRNTNPTTMMVFLFAVIDRERCGNQHGKRASVANAFSSSEMIARIYQTRRTSELYEGWGFGLHIAR